MLSKNAMTLLKQRYLLEGETWEGLVKRNVDTITDKHHEKYYQLIGDRVFLPNSPSLANAGKKNGGLFGCFTSGIEEDTLESIFDSTRDIGMVAKLGGGCGFTGSLLRSKNSKVSGSAHGYAIGPNAVAESISFFMDKITQNGLRAMALMYTLSAEHPDIEEFIYLKQTGNELACFNFNQSVFVKDDWMQRALIHPGSTEEHLLNKIAQHAWNNGEPGTLFEDTINNSPYKETGQYIYTTNPSLKKGTKVITSLGYLPIEDLEGKDFYVINLDGELSPANCWKSGNNKQLYRIKFSGGVEYFCTPEHKWPVINNGLAVNTFTNELSVGDIIPVSTTKKLTFGTKGSYEDGFFSGWLYGDGWLTDRKDGIRQAGIIVSSLDEQNNCLEPLKSKIKELSPNVNFIERKARKASWKEANFSVPKVQEFLDYYQLDKKFLGLPKSIWNDVTEDFIWGFIDGLISSDGHVRNNQIILTSAHESLSKEFSELLGIMGIKANVIYSETSSNFSKTKKYDRYNVTFSGSFFPEEFTLTHKQKNSQLKTGKKFHSFFYRQIEEVSMVDVFSDVWDIRVDDKKHCFSLSNIITGNCSEQGLPFYGSCNLASINLNHDYFNKKGYFDYNALEEVIAYMTYYLDRTGTVNKFPTQKHEDWYNENFPIGIGVMGLADYFLRYGVKYGSEESLKEIEKITRAIKEMSYLTSERLGKLLGVPKQCQKLDRPRRNITTVSIAPTGSIAMLAECSHGIEPIFSPSFKRIDERGQEYLYQHPLANEAYFVSAVGSRQATWKEQIDLVATAQKWVDSGISKTINLSNSATVQDVKEAIVYAWKRGCKGITLYRDGSRQVQVLNSVPTEEDIKDSTCKDGVCLL